MDESEDCTGCVKEFIGGNKPAKNTLTATMQDGMPYVLPPWRVNEIILLVIETLSEREYYKEDFDYKKMISDMGIKLKKFSSFNPENLEKFTQISLSLWNEGVCAVFPDPVTGEQRRMIAYNDKRNASECMNIIFHEFAHIIMRHTQQSISGEVEATCFALTMSLFIMIEQQFHVGQTVVKTIGKPFLVQGIKDAINKKEVA